MTASRVDERARLGAATPRAPDRVRLLVELGVRLALIDFYVRVLLIHHAVTGDWGPGLILGVLLVGEFGYRAAQGPSATPRRLPGWPLLAFAYGAGVILGWLPGFAGTAA